jgi:hypothetical protein
MNWSNKKTKPGNSIKERSSNILILLLIALFIPVHLLFSAVRDVKVGAISVEATHKANASLEAKLNEVAPLIAEAGNQNLDIVSIAEGNFGGKSQTFPNSVVLDSIKVWAKKYNINIIFQVDELEDSKIYNTAVLVGRDGNYVGKYRKVNLPPEESFKTPGDSYPVFNTDFGKIGILICWDGWFTEPSKTLVDKGAEMIFIPTWCNFRFNMKTITAENGVPISYAVHRIDCGVGKFVPSSVYNHLGFPVFENYFVGKNKIAIGTVTLGHYYNLALSKSVQASTGTDPVNPASNAVDGQYSTERDAPPEKLTSWKASSLPQWIEIDLGDDYDIDRVSIAQFNTNDYQYQIEGKAAGGNYSLLSDTLIKHETILEHGVAGSEILSSIFDTTNVRYVKVTVSSSVNTDLTINEIKVFGYDEKPTIIEESNINSGPKTFKLVQNYPNPFNAETIIQYSLKEKSDVNLMIYNMQGHIVKELVNENLASGEYQVKWDGTDLFLQCVSSGVYICKIEIESNSGKRIVDYNKMMFMK